MFWWCCGPGWLIGLLSGTFWIVVIVAAILLLRREVPHLRLPEHRPPALRVLEERYARGEIPREEFLERREVLLRAASHPAPAARPDQPPAPGDPSGGSNSAGGPASPPGAAPWSPEPPDPASEPQPGEPTTPLP